MTLELDSAVPDPAAPGTLAQGASHARLARVLGVFGGVLLTLSCITPASSLFILVPPMLADLGTGAPLTLLVAGLVSVGSHCATPSSARSSLRPAESTRSSVRCWVEVPPGWCSPSPPR